MWVDPSVCGVWGPARGLNQKPPVCKASALPRGHGPTNIRGRKSEGRANVKSIQNLTSHLIRTDRYNYITDLAKRLCDARRASQIFWTDFKRPINKKKNTNIPPPIEMVDL